jgi:hypothetical protein
MDPYLENLSWWANIHHGLISEMQADLNLRLRPKYHADVEERVHLADGEDERRSAVVPDIRILARPSRPVKPGPPDDGGLAVVEPIEVTTMIVEEIHEAYIQIVETLGRAVVAVIEVLSPANKTNGSAGRESYQKKRRQVLASTSHLVEIDLLRAGIRTHFKEQIPPYDYLVHVSRNLEPVSRKSLAWPIPITKPFPVISIPLKHEDPEVRVDLQKLLSSAYDRAAFDLKIDYSGGPVPQLTPEQAEWAKTLIAQLKDI